MALPVTFAYPTGSTLGYSIERMFDGFYYDFSNATFTGTPTTQVASLPEQTAPLLGRYRATISSTPQGTFTNGDYCVNVHNLGATPNTVILPLFTTAYNGSFATVIPSGSGDPWATALPGSYSAGTAGALLGGYVAPANASIASILTAVGTLSTNMATLGTNLTSVNSNVTAVGSAVTAVDTIVLAVKAVTDQLATTLQGSGPYSFTALALAAAPTGGGGGGSDPWTTQLPGSYATGSAGAILGRQTGFKLAADGVDAISIETGVNFRQATSIILAAAAGVSRGGPSDIITFKGGNSAVDRITATVDLFSNRTFVVLNLP